MTDIVSGYSEIMTEIFVTRFFLYNNFRIPSTKILAQLCFADLAPFVQFKKREKHPWSSVTFSFQAATLQKSNAPAWVFFKFFKLYKNGTKLRNALHIITLPVPIPDEEKKLKVHQCRSENLIKFSPLHENNVPEASHYKTFYFLRYAPPRCVTCLFTNMRKQQNMLKISLIFMKNANFTGK